MKKSQPLGLPVILALALWGVLWSPGVLAGYQWGFGDLSLNRLFWSQGTKDKAIAKTDFNYLELEGGAQFTWGELYGFFDLENFGKSASEVRSSSKGVIRAYIWQDKLSLYAHVFDFNSAGFGDQNRVLGLGYQFKGPGWWVKPFLGIHDVSQTYTSGPNGFMGGWVFGYNFQVFGEKFMVTDWHEIEFDRNAAYAFGNGGKKTSQNGALAAWWTPIKETTLGLQWRYAVDKLGTAGYMGALITSIRYNF